MRNFADRRRQIESTEGFLDLVECEYLYDCARRVTQGAIVEIGAYRGRSAVALGLGAMDGPRPMPPVYSVDPHRPFRGIYGGEFGPQDRVAYYEAMLRTGCATTVALINLPSEVVSVGWRDPVALLFIDGDHQYASVKRDTECWLPHVTREGTVVFDDAQLEDGGVRQVIAETLATGMYEVLPAPGKMAALKKL